MNLRELLSDLEHQEALTLDDRPIIWWDSETFWAAVDEAALGEVDAE